MSCDRLLPAPTPVPGEQPLTPLRDAGELIQQLPKAQALSATWQTAIEALMLAAEKRGPLLHAQVKMMKALHSGEPVYDPSHNDPHWGRHKLARDR